ncbi:hypothetical protein EsDP_00006279 [Epichloe bromicola]|uniref:Uncharacterized protein n=1 Tax=Epichloe bromicola TaxID=79588 RepID=A0ABQ0CX63_9HYPO
MTELNFSEENRNRLKELGYGTAAKPTELPTIPHETRHEQMKWYALGSLGKPPRNVLIIIVTKTRHDVALKVFACVFLSLTFSTTITSQANPDEITNAKSLKESAASVHDHNDSDELSVAQEDLVQAVVSLTLCSPKSRDEHLDALITEAGLASLLLLHYTTESVKLATFTLVHVAAYTDQHNKWTTKPAALLANRILDFQMSMSDPLNFVTDIVASDIVRPKLEPSSSPDLSESSAANVSTSTTPLKCTDDRQKLITVFEWALKKVETKYVAGHWHLFVPPLIDLAESRETTVKKKALQLIVNFLEKCPSTIIFKTGIDRLLENKIFPTLYLLPPLTLENDSALLIDTAYQVLTDLAVKTPELQSRSRRRLLDKLIREGVLDSYQRASDYVEVTTILLQNAAKLVSYLGIFAAKHLFVGIS